ncbi:hypothetical protein CTAYLR_010123 [Chrysophaeum taylorii]|uniref:Uncharacterized protein n=1 Tax=Chrysophaeum taylorii TaxID=2483200 RepID=A0AAD7UIX2_9STRA|nr:hypothetical protein CTAYLR_010123 [Chrysophaeum taylorii]
MKLLFCLLAGVAAFQAPVGVQRAGPLEASRRDLVERVSPAAIALALVVPTVADAAKPPQLASITPTAKPKSGQIKTSNAGSILKK